MKSHGFDIQSGHRPGLPVQFPVRARSRPNDVSPPFSHLSPLSKVIEIKISILKTILKKKNKARIWGCVFLGVSAE